MTLKTPAISTRRLQHTSALAIILLGLTCVVPARAADKPYADCAPVGTLPGYTADDKPDLYDYKGYDFDVSKDGDTVKKTVVGRYCGQNYTFHGQGDPMSPLEKQENFHAMLDQLGAKYVYTGDSYETVATVDKDGKQLWIYAEYGREDYNEVVVVEPRPFVATLTQPSGSDYKLLGHMPNYAADAAPEKRNYDQATFRVQDGDDSKDVKAQGAFFEVNYTVKPGAQLSSSLETQLNYRDALKKLGAQLVYTSDGDTDARLIHDGQTIWVHVESGREMYTTVTVIEEKPFQASFKPAQASELKTALDKDGHVALYINFDFDKATLRPDSAPVIAQVVALLKANPDLKLSIVGNTDNVGGHDYNTKLSQERAAAVVATLVKDGIAADRLASSGNGPDKPVASNDTSEGRAKNRRVELVKS